MPKTIDDVLKDAEIGPVVAEAIRAAGEITYERLHSAISTEEGFARLRPDFDRYANKAMRSFEENHPLPPKVGETLNARLDRIEKARAAEAAANELRFAVFRKATALGVDFELVQDLHFTDIKTAEAKLEQLAAAVSRKKIEDVNVTLAGGFKPGAGNRSDTPSGTYETWRAGLSVADQAALTNRH